MRKPVSPWIFLPILVLVGCSGDKVGERPDGSVMTPTHQLLRPAGELVTFPGRPVDMALSPNGKFLYAKDDRGVVVVETASWKIIQELGGASGSQHGIVVTSDGKTLYLSDAASGIHEGAIAEDGKVKWGRTLKMPAPKVGGAAYPNGMLLLPDGKQMVVALSRNNSLGVVDLASGSVREIPVDVAPFTVALAPDGKILVGNWADRPAAGKKTAPSSGTEVEIDERGIGVGGTVDLVDLNTGQIAAKALVGLQPSDIAVRGNTAYVANANSDTVTELELPTLKVRRQINVKPDAKLPFGSAPNALALDDKSGKLYVANGGNNAVAQIDLDHRNRIDGYVPTGWYPSSVIVRDGTLYIANAKGNGSRTKDPKDPSYSVYRFQGTIAKVALPDTKTLTAYTKQVKDDWNIPAILASQARKASKVAAVPVPKRLGDPSVFEHVVYILRENRTYDQLLGDIGRGDSEPSLAIYGQKVTPNLHALANEFVLLDNFYHNGVNSADGHAWSIEGNATAYFEKTFGGWTRSYPFGDDPLSVTSSGFLWDGILAHGLSFRNYGEYDYAAPKPGGNWAEIYEDFTKKTGKFSFVQNIGVERLRGYSMPGYPGWGLNIPDVVRADLFLKDFAELERTDKFPNLSIVYLPNDHTAGVSPGVPTPETLIAENDLATGQVVSAISKSKYWKNTVIFVMEDDPQAGVDHVDGHRSICMVVSPYTKRGAVISDFYNTVGMLHTIDQILGVPAMNQMVGRGPLMTNCFTDKPDLTPYEVRPNTTPFTLTPQPKKADSLLARLALATQKIPLDKPDEGNDDLLNRILWSEARPNEKYPAHFAGPHGSGLAKRGLKLMDQVTKDDD